MNIGLLIAINHFIISHIQTLSYGITSYFTSFYLFLLTKFIRKIQYLCPRNAKKFVKY